MKLAILALCLAAAPAFAGPCSVKEYAQYKDEGSTAFSRRLMALDYCRMSDSFDHSVAASASMQPTNKALASQFYRDAEVCRAEMSKVLNVITNARDYRAQKFAIGGCQKY